MLKVCNASLELRSFSPEFARVVAPLEELRNVVGPIEWTKDRADAFNNLKDLFSSNLVLRSIDWSKTVYLTTNSSIIGVGAWVGQEDENGHVVPVNCASKKMAPTQQRWSATKCELYALMWGMQKFRYYLLGRKFVARVDHRPLVHIFNKKELSPLLEGWFDTIMTYDFTVEYPPGIHNHFADALSRQDAVIPSVHAATVDGQDALIKNPSQALLMEAELRGKKIPSERHRALLLEQAHSVILQ
jgi:hypothetical protein